MGCHQPLDVRNEQQNNFMYVFIYRRGVCFIYVRRQFNGNNFTCDCNLFQDQYHNLNNLLLKVETLQNHFLYVGGLRILMLLFFQEGNRHFIFIISDEIET